MSATKREQERYGQNVEVASRSTDRVVYHIAETGGDMVRTCYQVFPGIELIYNDVHISSCSSENPVCNDVLEIHHCREGRMEYSLQDAFFYLTPGDLAINRQKGGSRDSYFPLSHYHGVTIVIDLEQAPECLSCLLGDVNVRPTMLVEKYCKDNQSFVVRSKPCLEHIFSELYAVPESIRRGYFKVKVLELLLFLSGMELGRDETPQRCVPNSQATLAKAVCKHLTEHMDSRVTIAQLAQRFYVSQTALKSSFKGVYGISVYTYIREQKMRAAALLLQKTDYSVLEIAGRCGYDNASKFAGAFRTVVGMSPCEYRTQEKK